MEHNAPLPPRAAGRAGVCLLGLGLLLNPWVIGRALSPTGRIESAASLGTIVVMETCLVLAGSVLCRRRPLRWKALAFSLTLGVGLFLALVCVDAYEAYRGLNARGGKNLVDVHDRDPVLGWKPRPNAVARHSLGGVFDARYEIDGRGFRQVPIHDEPVAHVYFLGDSFTFGEGVSNPETYPNILAERYLTDRANVYNLGVMGYGVLQMYLRYLSVEDQVRRGDYVVMAPILDDLFRGGGSYLLDLGRGLSREEIRRLRFPRFRNGQVEFVSFASPTGALETCYFFAKRTRALCGAIERALGLSTFQQSSIALQRMKERVEARGAHFILTYLPVVEEVSRGAYTFPPPGDYWNLIPYFPADPAERSRLAFPTDGHPSVEGHRAIARALTSLVVEKHLLEPSLLREAALVAPIRH